MARLLVIASLCVGCSNGAAPAHAPTTHRLHRTGTCPPERDDGAYDLDSARAAARRGRTARRFSDTLTSATTPIQLCGRSMLLAWLGRVTCDDGLPGSPTRTGSYMDVASCTKPVELYAVACPERSYEIYFDTYQCGPGEELFAPSR